MDLAKIADELPLRLIVGHAIEGFGGKDQIVRRVRSAVPLTKDDRDVLADWIEGKLSRRGPKKKWSIVRYLQDPPIHDAAFYVRSVLARMRRFDRARSRRIRRNRPSAKSSIAEPC